MTICVVCAKPLSQGSGLVYKGEQLIHVGCWTGKPATPPKTATEGSGAADRAAA
jgi:hypothetical protein